MSRCCMASLIKVFTVPTENPPAEAPSRYSPVTLILAAVVMVLCILAAGVLIIRSHRGGKYLD